LRWRWRAVPVLLLDEPTTGLDPRATSEFNALLASLRQRGVAVLMVTHDLLGAAAVADHIGYLERGRIVQTLSAAPAGKRFDVEARHQRYAAVQEAA
jgi:ABC-2 type transport system ATP-binding protein